MVFKQAEIQIINLSDDNGNNLFCSSVLLPAWSPLSYTKAPPPKALHGRTPFTQIIFGEHSQTIASVREKPLENNVTVEDSRGRAMGMSEVCGGQNPG